MAVITWPTTVPYLPSACAWLHVHNTRLSESPLSGYVQTQRIPGERWGMALDFPRQKYAERAMLEAWLAQLGGQEHRASVFDFANPVPRGNLALAGVTLGASAAQFATALTLAGCYPALNLLRYTEDFRNTPEAGATRPWGQFDDTGNAVLVSTVTAGSRTGADCSKLTANTTGAVPRQVSQSLGALPANTVVTFSVEVKAVECPAINIIITTRDPLYPYALFNLSAGTVQTYAAGAATLTSAAITALGSGWFRCTVTCDMRSGASTPAMTIKLRTVGNADYSGAIGDGVLLWAAQAEIGASATAYVGFGTLLAGDRIGLAGQVLMVTVDTPSASAAGALVVNVRHPLRAAASSGAALTLDRPRCLMLLAEPQLRVPRGSNGDCPAFSIELREVFA